MLYCTFSSSAPCLVLECIEFSMHSACLLKRLTCRFNIKFLRFCVFIHQLCLVCRITVMFLSSSKSTKKVVMKVNVQKVICIFKLFDALETSIPISQLKLFSNKRLCVILSDSKETCTYSQLGPSLVIWLNEIILPS